MKTKAPTKRSVLRRSARPKKINLAPQKAETSSYEQDFYKWTEAQAHFLKRGQITELDLENLSEEIKSLGKSDKRSLRSHLKILLLHLLKTKYQEKQTRSWKLSIANAQDEIKYILQDSPSLKRELPQLIKDAYPAARKEASIETGLDEKIFPKICPWVWEEIL